LYAWQSTRSLRPEQFERDPTRGGLDDLRPRNREEAATLSFLRLLELRDGNLVVNPEPASGAAPGQRNLVVYQRGEGGQLPGMSTG